MTPNQYKEIDQKIAHKFFELNEDFQNLQLDSVENKKGEDLRVIATSFQKRDGTIEVISPQEADRFNRSCGYVEYMKANHLDKYKL